MIYLVAIFIYLLVLAAIGIYKSRQVKTQEDFTVAGRTLSPWVMVCTMLAVWIGTGSIVGNAEKTYETGMAALILPIGTFIGMILLSLIASKARNIEASSVPEIIGGRFGQIARGLSVISLIIAYMVIVSYQFNAGGAVLEVITGERVPVTLQTGAKVTARQLTRGWVVFTPDKDWRGQTSVSITSHDANDITHDANDITHDANDITYSINVVTADEIAKAKEKLKEQKRSVAIRENNYKRVFYKDELLKDPSYTISSVPDNGLLELKEPKLTKETATIIAATAIILFTVLAGLMSLAYADIVTGIIITVAMLIAFPTYWFMAGGWEGMSAKFIAMGDRPQHMQLWGVFSTVDIINYCLPVFLLVLGDANQYQRIFASRDAKGAKSAVIAMIFVALAIELLIIGSAWIAASMTPDPENGKYILIYAARHYLPLPLGCLFMVTVVGIIISTADSFLLVPATTFIKDVYLNYINPNAPEKRTIFLSRLMVIVFGIIAFLVTRMFGETTGFFDKALYAFTIYGASITPSLVAAIVWPRATKAGAITSILAGTVTTLLWAEVIKDRLPPQLGKLKAVLPAIMLSLICLIVVSLFTQKSKPSGGDS